MHTASDVAKWFLAHNRIVNENGDAENLSNLKLQKLLYYAQGVFLGEKDRLLFTEPIRAWKHGPVVESVYHTYKTCGSNGIQYDDGFDFSIFTPEENNLLEEVYNVFGQYSAWKLREMTHNEDPWKNTKQSDEIDTGLIKEYFKREYIA